MNKSEKLIGYLQKYLFMQNTHFCEDVGVPQGTLKAWLRPINHRDYRPIPETEIERLLPLVEAYHFYYTSWVSLYCK